MKSNLSEKYILDIANANRPLEVEIFQLEQVKSPALLLGPDGQVVQTNKESRIWLGKDQNELKSSTLTQWLPEADENLIKQISEISPGKSVSWQGSQCKINFLSTMFSGQPAILALIQVTNQEWLAAATQRRNQDSNKEGLDARKSKKAKQSGDGFQDLHTQLLQGELAQLALREKSLSQFLQAAADLISKNLEIEMVFIEQVAQSLEEIQLFSDYVWSGSGGLKQKFMSLMEDISQQVVQTRSHLLYSESEIRKALPANPRFENQPLHILAVPLLHQNDMLGVLGFLSYREEVSNSDFEFKGLTLADHLAHLIAFYRERALENIQQQRVMKYSEQQSQACWAVNSGGTVTFFNKPFIEAVMQKGASFGTKILYQRQKGVRHQIGFSDWEDEYNKAFSGEKVAFEWQSADHFGNIYWWHISLLPMETQGLGVDEVIGIAADVTAEHQKDSALRIQQSRYLELIDAFEDIYFQADKTGIITSVSSAIQKITDLEPADFIGTNFSQYLVAKGQFHKELVELREGKLVSQVELNFRTREGKDHWMICNLKPRHSEWNEWLGFEGLARDNSAIKTANWNEKKSKSEADDALKIKERFLANISHEIRTPLNGIMGMVELLEDSKLDVQQKEYADIIKNSGQALLHVLNQLIDLSAAESGKILLRPHTVHLPSMMDGIKRLYSDQARLKNLNFTVELKTNFHSIKADENRLYQLVNNLVSNAFKFTISGNISIRAFSEMKDESEFLVFEIKDSGSGLSANEQALMKQLLQSTNPEYSFRATKGGLGLLTSKMIADAMSGFLTFQSSPGVGSTFWIHIPYQMAEESPVSFTSGKLSLETRKTIRFQKYSPMVLLVDDNAVNLKVAQEILIKSGCKVEIATNGEEAVEKAKTGFFHVILMDIQMPVMDGVVATEHIKNADLSYIPYIIAMTAYCLKEDKKRFVEAGMDDFVAKPISGDKILTKVKYWTEKCLAQLQPDERNAIQSGKSVLTRRQSLESIFDFDALRGLVKHVGDDILFDSISEFANETTQMLVEIEEAVKSENWPVIRSHAHTLKGNAGTFGLKRLSNIARLMESDLKNDKLAALPKQLEELRNAATQFLESYPNLSKNHDWKN